MSELPATAESLPCGTVPAAIAAAPRWRQCVARFWAERAPRVRRRWWWIALALAVIGFFREVMPLAVVISPSVAPSLVVVLRGSAVRVGDLAAYRYPGARIGDFRQGDLMIHWIAGGPGAVVAVAPNRAVSVDGRPVGGALGQTRKGEPLEPVRPRVVPSDYFYVMGTASNALDSRYEAAGLVHRADFLGRAVVLF